MLTITEIARLAPRRSQRASACATRCSRARWLGAKASLAVIALFLLLFWYRGWQLNRARRVRGAELASAGELRRRIRPPWDAGARGALGVHLRPAPLPHRRACRTLERTETQHTIVSGTTGLGQDRAHLRPGRPGPRPGRALRRLRQDGELHPPRSSMRRSDVLLNPLDARRAPRWSPFFEARSPRDFDTMAAALVPQQKDTVDPFWVTAARQLFSNGAGVLWRKDV